MLAMLGKNRNFFLTAEYDVTKGEFLYGADTYS